MGCSKDKVHESEKSIEGCSEIEQNFGAHTNNNNPPVLKLLSELNSFNKEYTNVKREDLEDEYDNNVDGSANLGVSSQNLEEEAELRLGKQQLKDVKRK